MARRKTKRLLSEGEMRRFMKLASISPMNEMYGMAPGQRDEEEEEEMPMGDEMEVSADEVEMDVEEPAADLPAEEPAMDDMEMDMEPAGEAGMVDVEQFMSALESALEEVTGEEVSTEMDLGDEKAPEEGGEDEPAMDDMEMSPEPVEDEEPMMDDEEEPMMEDMDELAEAIARRVRRKLAESRRPAKREVSKKQTVERVANRVMKRLDEEKKAKENLDKRADELTDRIFKRLMKESR